MIPAILLGAFLAVSGLTAAWRPAPRTRRIGRTRINGRRSRPTVRTTGYATMRVRPPTEAPADTTSRMDLAA